MDRTDHEIGLRLKQICKRLGIPVGDLNRLAEIAPQLVVDPAGLSFGIRGRDYVFLDFNASARKKKTWYLRMKWGMSCLGIYWQTTS